MIKSSKKVIVLAAHTKFRRIAPIKVADTKSIYQIITDNGIKEADKLDIERFDTEVIVAKKDILI
jgi:DeoR/GlpR family transcriptional regulator of sugar metabolism